MNREVVQQKKGFSIFAKLLSGFVFIIVITGIGDYYSYSQMNHLSDLTTKIFNHPLRVTRAVLSANICIIKMHRSMKDVVFSSTDLELDTAINYVNSYEREVLKYFKIIENWILDDEGAFLLSETIKLFRDWKPIRDEVISLTKNGNRLKAFGITKGKGAKHVDLLNSKMDKLKDYAATKASNMLSDSQTAQKSVIQTSSIIFFMTILLSGLFCYLFSRMITDSIKQLKKGVEEFAHGNMDYKVHVKFKDEISWLANAFNEMSEHCKKVIEELKLQSEIVANMAEGVYLIGAEDGIIIFANTKLEVMFGYSPNEMNSKHISMINAPAEKRPKEITGDIMRKVIETGEWHCEVNNIKKDGTTFWSSVNVSIFEHSKYGKVLIFVHTDISERKHLENELLEQRINLEKTVKKRTNDLEKEIAKHKKTEMELRNSELLLNNHLTELNQIYKTAPIGLCFMSPDLRYLRINEIMATINGRPVSYHINRTIKEIIPELSDQIEPIYQQVIKTGKPVLNLEVQGTTQAQPDVIKNWMVSYYPVKKDDGAIIGISAVVIDITKQKRAEQQIKDSLKEKEILLQEIHHRVKNNMQIIASLLKLQANTVTDTRMKEILNESQGRVYAMSAVHEALYQSENLSEIDIKHYLENITGTLLQSYLDNTFEVQFKIASDDIKINIEKANPLGLIINELITNALKYAFPNGKKGWITLSVKCKDKNHLEMIIEDDGVGMPENFHWGESNTLGLSLVYNLVKKQLDGSIKMESNNGTRFTIKFDLNDT